VTTVSDVSARLERLAAVLARPDLYASKGLGNEVNFHVFAYPPEAASVVEAYVPKLEKQLRDRGIDVFVFNVFGEMVEMLRESGDLDAARTLEHEQGTTAFARAVRPLIHAQAMAERLQRMRQEVSHDLVMIVGVGGAYPLVRAHQLLNNLHAEVEDVPVILMYPGSYDGTAFRLFGRLDDDHHYRAFVLVEQVD
jgi:hypothetical protein